MSTLHLLPGLPLPTLPLPPFSIPQFLLAAAILASTYGTYISLCPPNIETAPAPATGDTLRLSLVTSRHFPKFSLSPFIFLAIHTSLLVLYYPNIPPSLLPSGGNNIDNTLNTNLITWTPLTIIPLFLIIFLGVPLRLNSYTALGKDFTFTLTEPDRLVTGGIYKYVQHPSYVGVFILGFVNLALLGRTDGAAGVWLGSKNTAKTIYVLVWGVYMSCLTLGFWRRVLEEERMLKGKFGGEWVRWNRRTARFIPGVF